MNITCIEDLQEAQRAWHALSPDKTIWDNWDFRFCFYKYWKYPIAFYVVHEDDEMIAVLPLQFNTDQGHLEFFGGSYMESNKAFVKAGHEESISALYGAIDKPAKLIDIEGDDPFTSALSFSQYKYVLDLSTYNAPEDYVNQNFEGKNRRDFRAKVTYADKHYNPRVVFGEQENIQYMIEQNKKSFGEESSFFWPHRSEIFLDLVKLPFDWHILSMYIDNTLQGVSLSVAYKENYIYLNAGVNKADFPNIGSSMIYKNIGKAIELKLNAFDACVSDYGWKERWHLGKIPQYTFTRMIAATGQ